MVSACLDSEPRGPRALLVDGEAGIGKSTVWFEAVRLAEARGYRVLRARPAESEAKLSYATLADLVGLVFDEARAQLPHPQELALAAALLRVTSHEPADPRTVATAVVGVLTELVREQPVLVAIDDVQWVDLASRRALEFAARRLPAQLRLCVTRRSEGAVDVPLELDRAASGHRRRAAASCMVAASSPRWTGSSTVLWPVTRDGRAVCRVRGDVLFLRASVPRAVREIPRYRLRHLS